MSTILQTKVQLFCVCNSLWSIENTSGSQGEIIFEILPIQNLQIQQYREHQQQPNGNFTNILRAAFLPIFLCHESIKLTLEYKNTVSTYFVQKNVGEIDTWLMNESKRMCIVNFNSSVDKNL
jgi:hypothetical protein